MWGEKSVGGRSATQSPASAGISDSGFLKTSANLSRLLMVMFSACANVPPSLKIGRFISRNRLFSVNSLIF